MAEDTTKSTPVEAKADTISLTIDGRAVTVPKGTTLLNAAASLGIYIPTLCWHPKLKAVGACRVCYVEVEKWPKLAVACATEATDGMVVHTASDQVKKGRRAVIEFILANHPLDCPTCDQAGECELQNVTFAYCIDDSRFEFRKSRFVEEGMTTTFDDLRIGPELILNRNRCLLCYKCVRANKEAFGEHDLGVYERGNITRIGPAPGRQVTNPFSGNLAEICPVGALTSADWRYKIRVWLTTSVPSVCNFTSSGSNILLYKEDHKNHIYRTTSRTNDDIDDGWLADVSRYGYQVATSPERLPEPLIKKDGKQVPASWEEAMELIHKRFTEIQQTMGRVCIGGLIAPNLDNASLYGFSKFFRTVLNSNNIDFRCDYPMLPSVGDSVFSRLCRQPFRIADIDDSDVIVAFGSDLIREHPNEYLRIRRARTFGKPRIYSINPFSVKSADVSDLELVYRAGADELALTGICLAAVEENLVDSAMADEFKSKVAPNTLAEAAAACGVDEAELRIVARALAEGRKVSFIVGELVTRSVARESIGAAVANLDRMFGIRGKGQLSVLARQANSRGAEKMGVLPEPAAPTREKLTALWGMFPDSQANNSDAMLALMKKEEISGLFVVGSNPIMLYPDQEFVREGLGKLDFLVVCDLFETETTALADVVLPLSSWAEYDGEYVNLEGRVQSARRAIRPVGKSRPAYEIIMALADKFGTDAFPSLEQLSLEAGCLLDVNDQPPLPDEFLEVKPAVEEPDKEYPLPIFVCDDPHHRGHLTEKAPSLANFASEAYVELSPGLAVEGNLSDGDLVRVESETGKIIVAARISEHLENNCLLVPCNFSATPVMSLLMRKRRINRVKISKVDD